MMKKILAWSAIKMPGQCVSAHDPAVIIDDIRSNVSALVNHALDRGSRAIDEVVRAHQNHAHQKDGKGDLKSGLR